VKAEPTPAFMFGPVIAATASAWLPLSETSQRGLSTPSTDLSVSGSGRRDRSSTSQRSDVGVSDSWMAGRSGDECATIAEG
jgi:hypothetical protein